MHISFIRRRIQSLQRYDRNVTTIGRINENTHIFVKKALEEKKEQLSGLIVNPMSKFVHQDKYFHRAKQDDLGSQRLQVERNPGKI